MNGPVTLELVHVYIHVFAFYFDKCSFCPRPDINLWVCSGGLWEESIDVLTNELRGDRAAGDGKPRPVSVWINIVTGLNGEERPGRTGEEESSLPAVSSQKQQEEKQYNIT